MGGFIYLWMQSCKAWTLLFFRNWNCFIPLEMWRITSCGDTGTEWSIQWQSYLTQTWILLKRGFHIDSVPRRLFDMIVVVLCVAAGWTGVNLIQFKAAFFLFFFSPTSIKSGAMPPCNCFSQVYLFLSFRIVFCLNSVGSRSLSCAHWNVETLLSRLS